MNRLARRLMLSLSYVHQDLDCIRFFAVGDPSVITRLFQSLDDLRESMASISSADAALNTLKSLSVVAGLLNHLFSQEGHLVDDPVMEAFNLSAESLLDDRGVLDTSRLLAGYYGRYDELDKRASQILTEVSSSRFPLPDSARYSLHLAAVDRPLLVLRTARYVDCVARQISTLPNADDRVAALRTNRSRVDKSSANHRRIVESRTRRHDSRSGAATAAAALDAYRQTVEGQLRPSVWGLLGFLGFVSTGDQMPELSSLRDRLLAAHLRVFEDAASTIVPALRNAAAHEDYLWDDRTSKIDLGDVRFSLDYVDTAAARAYEHMVGAELGIASAQFDLPGLYDALRRDDPDTGYRAFREVLALSVFGTNGAVVDEWAYDAGVFSVIIDPIDSVKFSPVFQALMWAALLIPGSTRFIVRLSDREAPVVDIGREPLELTYQVWLPSRSWFDSMIPSVFLPANAAARLAVEDVEACLTSATWLAVNDILHAVCDHLETLEVSGSSGPDSEIGLCRKLRVISAAVSATAGMFDTSDPLQVAIALCREGIKELDKRPKDRHSSWLGLYHQRVAREYDRWPVAPVVPTVAQLEEEPLWMP